MTKTKTSAKTAAAPKAKKSAPTKARRPKKATPPAPPAIPLQLEGIDEKLTDYFNGIATVWRERLAEADSLSRPFLSLCLDCADFTQVEDEGVERLGDVQTEFCESCFRMMPTEIDPAGQYALKAELPTAIRIAPSAAAGAQLVELIYTEETPKIAMLYGGRELVLDLYYPPTFDIAKLPYLAKTQPRLTHDRYSVRVRFAGAQS